MPAVKLPDQALQEAIDLRAKHGGVKQAADAGGIPYGTLLHRCRAADRRGITPQIRVSILTERGGERVLFIPDLHTPFHHPDAFDFLAECNRALSPSRIVCAGDEADQHALSQYESDPDGHSAGTEFELSREALSELARLFPVMALCDSNHMVRYLKKAFRAGIPSVYMKSYQAAYEAPPGWIWRDSWLIDGVMYIHGEGFSGKDGAYKACVQYRRPVVMGHLHSFAGVQYNNNGDTQIWGMNAGCLIDAQRYAFKYAKHVPHKPCIGVGLVDHGTPHWFPMRMDKHQRWIGKL
jgi:hypothetical protein